MPRTGPPARAGRKQPPDGSFQRRGTAQPPVRRTRNMAMEVLIVEDDDAMAGALAAGVGTAGLKATRVSRGADALLAHRNFQVVLLDLGLPDMDGLEVLRKLRQVTDCPILILTARD